MNAHGGTGPLIAKAGIVLTVHFSGRSFFTFTTIWPVKRSAARAHMLEHCSTLELTHRSAAAHRSPCTGAVPDLEQEGSNGVAGFTGDEVVACCLEWGGAWHAKLGLSTHIQAARG